MDTKTTIFVGNLPFNTDEEEIRKFFIECGTIDYIRMIIDPRTHNGKGIAYIKFREGTGYLNGLKQNMKQYRDRQIRVKKALLMGEDKKPLSKKEAKPRWDEERKRVQKQMRGDNSKEEKADFSAFADKVKKNEDEFDYDLDNIVETGIGINQVGKVPMSSISKQIKKVKKKGLDQEDAVKKINKIKNRHHKK